MGVLRLRTGRPLLPVTLAAAVVLAAACEGPNQFRTPISATGEAPRVEIEVPTGGAQSARPVGDSVLVRVRVRDNQGVTGVSFEGVALRGDPSLGTDEVVARYQPREVTLAGVRDTVLTRYLQPTDDDTKETASIIVTAVDEEGNESADTVSLIIGGPDVQILNLVDDQAVRAGLSLNLSAVARDPQGINQISFQLSGAFEATLTRSIVPTADSVRLDTLVAIPAGVTGNLQIMATARNAEDLVGQDALTVRVVAGGAGDVTRPTVRLQVSALPSLELKDSLYVLVSGNDDPQGSGIARVGYTVRAISPSRQDTLVRTGEQAYSPPRTGTVARQFAVPVFNVDTLNLPDTLVYEVTGYMIDEAGNCGAAVESDTPQSLTCATLPGGQVSAEGRTGLRVVRPHVAGRTVVLPSGGRIMDAAVDTVRRNLFLSNIETNRLEVFRMDPETFGQSIAVGSQPWGLSLTRDGDSLWVANSGGTNMSVVNLDTEREENNSRLLTPDVVLFDIELKANDVSVQYTIFPLPQFNSPAFSDRPQFMAVDSFGNVVYSTKTTLVGDVGTARKAYYPAGAERSEVKLFVEHGLTSQTDNFWAVAHIDSIGASIDTVGIVNDTPVLAAALTLYDHVPGFPNQVIVGRAATVQGELPTDAWAELVAQGSDAYMVEGARWNVPSLGFQDTTYVAASGDGGWVAVGEGSRAPVGRVLMYGASPNEVTALSGVVPVANLFVNNSEEVRGLGMNYDGTLGVVRGRQEVSFFSPDLLRQGGVTIPLGESGSGATMHPLHANAKTLDNFSGTYRPDTHMAFVGTGQRTVDIIDTWHHTRIGRIAIRDVVTGPLRAVLPFPGDNLGLTCSTVPVTDKRGNYIGDAVQLYTGGDFNNPIGPTGASEDRCVVVKLFATTSVGGVVVIDVRKGDVLRNHPERN
jgi:DNA-binding beta-propeller fold protein YncE